MIDLPQEGDLPLDIAVSAITLAELAAGPHATNDRRSGPPAIEVQGDRIALA